MIDPRLVVRVASAPVSAIDGEFFRHASLAWPPLQGNRSGGRWGPRGAYPVLYLGRPQDSVTVEAYRHLVDDVEGMRGELIGPRRFVTCRVNVSHVLDLREPAGLLAVGLTLAELMGPHAPCQRVGQVAHQLGLHGIVAPAATAMGETLALFELQLAAGELPVLVNEERWAHLPPDPRAYRVLQGGAGDSA